MTNTTRRPVRQGDVILFPVDQVPHGARTIEHRAPRIVVREGEATGHHHSVATVDVDEVVSDVERFLVVHRATELVHQEHGAVPVPAGAYRIIPQREVDPWGGWRPVLD